MDALTLRNATFRSTPMRMWPRYTIAPTLVAVTGANVRSSLPIARPQMMKPMKTPASPKFSQKSPSMVMAWEDALSGWSGAMKVRVKYRPIESTWNSRSKYPDTTGIADTAGCHKDWPPRWSLYSGTRS